ncbi:energy-coupling factor ABC transporter ATP-binding protein [Microbacterium sp. zg.B48]|uniref:energy-coupling factor ABC transporter ATP-binding protein n=1 Tax=Microbacterium sp. zg.B48 TaxID=2969408 RepID=UPI00214C01B4|nr:ABC transporter ATP-binding protein [Microbacterium sp. zg.B48]MCR2764836.1 energy-coupling factor ABC transporter ATP-binding protein [Microbacterium sp. zg.B48]
MSADPAGLAFDGVRFAYPGDASGREVLAGVSFRVSPAERVAVLGPNGAGKTTLMLHLNGTLTPTAGTVSIAGAVVSRQNVREIRRRVGLVFQDPDDQLFMPTVGEDVAFGPANCGIRGGELESRVAIALAQVGLHGAEHRYPQRLSLGERRRAAIATILAMDVEVVVLDEPTSNLDPSARRALSATLSDLDSTVLVVTHDLPFALEVCQRSVVLNGGRIVADGPTAELLGDAALMAAHGLELPWGFDPAVAVRQRAQR